MSKLGLVRNDGTIGGAGNKSLPSKINDNKLEKDTLWTKTCAMNEMVIEKHGLTNTIGALTTGIEFFVNEKWEDNPEFDLTQEHRNYEFARDVMDATMSGLDINYSSENKTDYVAQLDKLISDLTKLRKRYA